MAKTGLPNSFNIDDKDLIACCRTLARNKAIVFDCIVPEAFELCCKAVYMENCANLKQRRTYVKAMFSEPFWKRKTSRFCTTARLICINKEDEKYPMIEKIRPNVYVYTYTDF